MDRYLVMKSFEKKVTHVHSTKVCAELYSQESSKYQNKLS